jgi:hypothetical protein
MAGMTSSPDILSTTAYTSGDYDFVALGECIMVRGVILYKGCYLFNGDAQPYQNAGSHTEYAYLKDQNTLELKGYQYSGSAYGIASNTDLTIVVYDEENSLEAKDDYSAIAVTGNLTIVDGTNYSDKLTLKSASGYALYVYKNYTHNNVRLNASSSNFYPVYVKGNFAFNTGNFDTTSTYTGTTHNYPALTVEGNATFAKGFLNATAAPNYGDAMAITGNANFSGATVTATSAKGNGIKVASGYLGVHGSKLTVTAGQNGIYLVAGRLNMSEGFLTVSSSNTASDSTYAALKLAGTSSDYYNVASALAQSASIASTPSNLQKIAPTYLSGYDYVMIGDYIMIAGKVVKGGQSIDSAGKVVDGNGGSGYAYYSGNTLTLNSCNFTTTTCRCIESFVDLSINVTGASSITATGYVGIYVGGDVTVSATKSLNVNSNVTAIYTTGNGTLSGNITLKTTDNKSALVADGTLTVKSGKLTVTAEDTGVSAGAMSVTGGDVNITAKKNGIYIADGKFSMTGGTATISSTYSPIKADTYTIGSDLVVLGSANSDGTGLQAIATNKIKDCKYVKISVCGHADALTDKDHNCDYCGKEEITRPNRVKTEYDDTYHWGVCDCGEKMAGTGEEHTFVAGICSCGKKASAPTINVPASMTVKQGENLDLYCSATSPDGSKLSYLWYSTSTGKLEDIIAINRGAETNDTLHVDTSTPGIYYYVCGVDTANGGSAYSSIITVIVRGLAPVISVPKSMTVTQGENLDLYCSATSPDGSKLSYLWYSTSTGKLEDIIAVNRGSETNDTLHVDTSTPGIYYYVCGVDTANGGSAYSSIITVTVLEKTTSIQVNYIGTINYTVSGNVVKVTHDLACKVGYLSGGEYVAITPTANDDGSYSFAVPAGVTEVLLVVAGDVNGDGDVDSSDYGRLNAVLLKKTSLSVEANFAADCNGDGDLDSSDYGRLNAVLLKKTTMKW